MTLEESAVLEKLRRQYDSIHDNLDSLLDACGDDPILKRQVGDSMQEALRNYIVAQNRILNQSAIKIKQLSDTADKGQKEIDQALLELKQINVTVSAITKAVKNIAIIVASL